VDFSFLIRPFAEFVFQYAKQAANIYTHEQEAQRKAIAKHLLSIATCLGELASELRLEKPNKVMRLRGELGMHTRLLLGPLPAYVELDESGSIAELLRNAEELARRTNPVEWAVMPERDKNALADRIDLCVGMCFAVASVCETPVAQRPVRLFRRSLPQGTPPEKITAIAVTLEASPQPEFKRFPATELGGYNEEFYRYFIDRIDCARSALYITGTGFNCLTPRGYRLARDMCDAMRRALGRGVTVVRIQTTTDVSLHYVAMLCELLNEWPEQFRLFLRSAKDAVDMVDWCVIDPKIRETCSVEWSMSSNVRFGVKEASLATAAFFVGNNLDFAEDIFIKINELARPEFSTRIRTADSLGELTRSTELYFAYGSNMSREQMKERAENAQLIGIGYMEDYTLAFNRRGTHRSGGVASVVEAKGERVYGVIWEISSKELKRLDKEEDPDAYRRSPLSVVVEGNISYTCHVYVAIAQGRIDPDPEYVRILVDAACDADLPADYLKFLESWQT
jgi:gamma-glutamylcyclotransferase (GGCT)/AIG2-like uncharacterized protein YtfP